MGYNAEQKVCLDLFPQVTACSFSKLPWNKLFNYHVEKPSVLLKPDTAFPSLYGALRQQQLQESEAFSK